MEIWSLEVQMAISPMCHSCRYIFKFSYTLTRKRTPWKIGLWRGEVKLGSCCCISLIVCSTWHDVVCLKCDSTTCNLIQCNILQWSHSRSSKTANNQSEVMTVWSTHLSLVFRCSSCSSTLNWNIALPLIHQFNEQQMDSVLLSRWWQCESHLFVFLKSLFSLLFLVSYLLHQFLHLETLV